MEPYISTTVTGVTLLFLVGIIGIFVYSLRCRLIVSKTVTGNKRLIGNMRFLLRWLGANIPEFQNFEYLPTTRIKDHGGSKLTDESSKSIRGDPSDVDSDEIDDMIEPRKRTSSAKQYYKYYKVPSVGTHYFRYQNCLIRLQRKTLDGKSENTSQEADILIFTTLAKNSEVLESMLEAAKSKLYTRLSGIPKYRKNEIAVYYPNSSLTEWTALRLQSTKRPLETLALADNLGENLLADVNKFLTKEEWYYKKGIPWRKTYLLHGPPGCGKSSLVKAIAGKIGFDISILPLTEKLSDETIIRLLNRAPKRSIILMEEVDAAFHKGPNAEDIIQDDSEHFAYSSRTWATLSASGFYNALDGIGAPEDGLVIFMTSSHPERLHRSLFRPGRVDYYVLLDYPNKSQLEMMFARFFPEADDNQKQSFLRIVKDCQDVDIKVSVAMIQGLFVKYSESVEQVLEGAEEFIRHKFSDKNNNNSSSHIYM